MSQAKRIVLVSRPVRRAQGSDFRLRLRHADTGRGPGFAAHIGLSLDHYRRGRMSDVPSYAATGRWRRDGGRHGV